MFEPPDQLQSSGDLIGRAVRLLRRHLLLVLKVLIGPTIVVALGAGAFQFFSYPFMKHWENHGRAFNFSNAAMAVPWAALAASLLVTWIAHWVILVRVLAFLRLSAGFAADYAQSDRFLWRRKWHVLLIMLLIFGALVFVFSFWTIELIICLVMTKAGALLTALGFTGLLAFPFGFIFSICSVLLAQFICFAVLACEENGLGATIGRGLTLLTGGFWRIFGFSLLLILVINAIAMPLSAPLAGLVAADGFHHAFCTGAGAYHMPLYLAVVSAVWNSLLVMLTCPAYFIAFGLLYHDLRLRQEGLDIKQRLDLLEGNVP